jgi:hypothetical protein
MFAMGAIQIRESGLESHLLKQWVGRDINGAWTVDSAVLSPGQLILVFVTMMFAFSSSLAVLATEKAFSFFKRLF